MHLTRIMTGPDKGKYMDSNTGRIMSEEEYGRHFDRGHGFEDGHMMAEGQMHMDFMERGFRHDR